MRSEMAWMRIILGGIGGGALPAVLIIGSTIAYDALGGSAAQTQAFMVVAGMVIGIAGGAGLTFLFAVWAARKTERRSIAHGAGVGMLSFAVDLALVSIAVTEFTAPILLALILRPPAGLLGGWWVGRAVSAGRKGGEATIETAARP